MPNKYPLNKVFLPAGQCAEQILDNVMGGHLRVSLHLHLVSGSKLFKRGDIVYAQACREHSVGKFTLGK